MNVKQIYSFLKKLEANNNREWFNEHRSEYLTMTDNYHQLAALLISLVGEVDPSAEQMRVQDVVYRIYRDTRFSTDKTPYKDHAGIFINPPRGKKSLRYGYYFHLQPGASIIAAGNMPGPTALTNAIRQEIFANVEEYLDIIRDPEFTKYFPTVGADPLVKAPAGFPKDWEYIDLLRPRSFGAEIDVADSFYCDTETLTERLRPIIKQMKRLNDFVNYTVDGFEGFE